MLLRSLLASAILHVCLWGVSPIRLIHKPTAGTSKRPLYGGIFLCWRKFKKSVTVLVCSETTLQVKRQYSDASNIYFSQKTLGWRIDFKKLIEYFKRESNLYRIIFYRAINPDNEWERRFHDFLEIVGYTVKHKKIKFIKDKTDQERGGHHKGNIDVDLTIDAVHLRDEYDSFILLSGDGDFESLLKYLKAYKKRCIILSTKSHVSIELIRQAKFIDFKKIKSEIAFP